MSDNQDINPEGVKASASVGLPGLETEIRATQAAILATQTAVTDLRAELDLDRQEQKARIEKLRAETEKLHRERRYAPITLIVSSVGAVAALVAAVHGLLK